MSSSSQLTVGKVVASEKINLPTYNTVNDLPTSGEAEGTIAYVLLEGRIYVFSQTETTTDLAWRKVPSTGNEWQLVI